MSDKNESNISTEEEMNNIEKEDIENTDNNVQVNETSSESNNESIEENQNDENQDGPQEFFIDLATMFGPEEVQTVINNKGEKVFVASQNVVNMMNQMSTEENPDEVNNIPPTPNLSDGDNIDSEPINIQQPFGIPDHTYIELFNTYKQLFENITKDVESLNNKYEDLIKAIDKNINSNMKELHSAIKVTQIYSKLLTKIFIGIDITIIILIIILFIIK